MIVARVWFSSLMRTPSLASTAWCRPSLQFRPGHQAAGEFVDDDHLVVFDHVVHVALVKVMGFKRVVDQVRPFHVPGGVKAFHARQLLGRAHAFVGQMRGVLFFLDLEVRVFFQLPGDAVGHGVAADVVEAPGRK